MSSSTREIERELRKAIEVQGERELKRELKRYTEEVAEDARRIALEDMDQGYATGEFVASIKTRMRNLKGRLPSAQVYSKDSKAHLLEYGTEDTPEYGTFAKVAFRHGGVPDGGNEE